ncbi:hypothetical protein [Lentibacillus sp. Marseille-P4043]|nr:hypothetical protein [Lentibacillus sp. Marseille-P4043]
MEILKKEFNVLILDDDILVEKLEATMLAQNKSTEPVFKMKYDP